MTPHKSQLFTLATDIDDYAVMTLDEQGIIEQWNKGAESIYGYSADEVIGKNFSLIYPLQRDIFEEDQPKTLLEKVRRDGKVSETGWRAKKNGSVFLANVAAAAIYDQRNCVIGYDHIASDQTARTKTKYGTKVANSIFAMLAYWDKNQVCRFANDAYEEWFGKTGDEMTNKITQKDLLGDTYEKNLVYTTAVLNGQPQFFERKIKIPSGEERYAFVSYYPDIVHDEVKGFSVHVADITQQKKVELSLNQSNDRNKIFVEKAPTALAMFDKEMRYMAASEKWIEDYALQGRNIIGMSHYEIFPEIKDEWRSIHQKCMKGHTDRCAEASFPRLDGSLQWISWDVRPWYISEGHVGGLLMHTADITERVENQKKMVEAKDHLEILAQRLTVQNTQLANFAHITSHNLRSPVSNLNSLLYLYNLAKDKDEKKFIFEKFQTVIHHLSSTLNSLAEALKIKENANEELERVLFEEVMNKTKEIVTAQLSESGAQIKCDFSKAPQVEYNRVYLESIFLNLITNALKYRSPDRFPVVNIKTEHTGGKIKFTIQDNGLGIDLEKHGQKLFGLHKTFHRHAEARGVGLYITKTQIESMGGTISASSEPDQGTTFTIFFR